MSQIKITKLKCTLVQYVYEHCSCTTLVYAHFKSVHIVNILQAVQDTRILILIYYGT